MNGPQNEEWAAENSNTLTRQIQTMILRYINWNADPEIIKGV